VSDTSTVVESELRRPRSPLRRLLASRAHDMSATLARLCAHDLLVDRVMLDLARGHFLGPEQAELERLLPPLMQSVGFDALLLRSTSRSRASSG